MEVLNQIIGMLAGLVAIFTFTTGINSVSQLRKAGRETQSSPSSGSSPPSAPSTSNPAIIHLLFLALVFGVSVVVTATMGLSGSDTGGIVCLLLSAAAIGVFAFQWSGISKLVPLAAYGAVLAATLAGLGLMFGTISRGEELFGLGAGVAIGAGAWLITALTGRPASPRVLVRSNRHPIESRDEKVILEIAAQQNGRVRVTDVALQSDIGLDKATEILESLAQRNHCRKEVQASGAIAYEFPDLQNARTGD